MTSSVVPEKFDSGDIVSWLRQFECCASANSWNDTKKLAVLPAFLRGPAATYYHSLAADQKDSYANLTKHLREALCPAVDRERYFADFEQRVLRPQEDPSLFLWELKDILSKANPDLQAEAREALLSRQFMRGLPSLIRLKLLENNPTPTLVDMTAFVQRFRAVHRHDDASSFVQAMQTSTPVGPPAEGPLATSIAQLTAAVTALASDQKDLRAALVPPSGVGRPRNPQESFNIRRGGGGGWGRSRNQSQQRCFNCNMIGHFVRDCPWDSQCHLCLGWGHSSQQCANNVHQRGSQSGTRPLNFKGVPQ